METVKLARTMLILLMALLWVPITAHCELESLPGLEFLRCDSQSDHSSEESKGCGDQCCQVESGHYHIPRNQLTAPAALLLVTLDLINDSQAAVSPVPCPGLQTASPPELRVTWQFISRAALPVRAPSLAS